MFDFITLLGLSVFSLFGGTVLYLLLWALLPLFGIELPFSYWQLIEICFYVIMLLWFLPFAIGSLLSANHTRKITYRIKAPIELVFDVVADYQNRADWYEGIAQTFNISTQDQERWRWVSPDKMSGIVQITEKQRPTYLETQESLNLEQTDEHDEFSEAMLGKTTFKSTHSLSEKNGITSVTYESTAYNTAPWLRFMSRLYIKRFAQAEYMKKITKRVQQLQTLP